VSLWLDNDELVALTGKKHRSKQIKVLAAMRPPIKSASPGIPVLPLIRKGIRDREVVSILRSWALDWAASPRVWMGRSHQQRTAVLRNESL